MIRTIAMEQSSEIWVNWVSRMSTMSRRIAIKFGPLVSAILTLTYSLPILPTVKITLKSYWNMLRVETLAIDRGSCSCRLGFTRRITTNNSRQTWNHSISYRENDIHIYPPNSFEKRRRVMFTKSHHPLSACGTFGAELPPKMKNWLRTTRKRSERIWMARVTWLEARVHYETCVGKETERRVDNKG